MSYTVQIVPKLPPAIDGLGDYALNLARPLYKGFGHKTVFIVCDPTWSGPKLLEDFDVTQIAERSASKLADCLPANQNSCAQVLLHYVGYGYAKRGCPSWLVEALEKWKSQVSGARLITMFHEVYASGPPWRSSFWLSRLQRNLATRLAVLSDQCISSRQGNAEVIQRLSRGKHSRVPTLPVFSNIGEPDGTTPLSSRERRLVVFGGRRTRQRVYQRSLAALRRACHQLKIETIIDIGPPLESTVPSVDGIPVVAAGELPASEASRYMSSSVAGFFDYHLSYLAKSTVFASYCAHRLIPVGAPYDVPQVDGLKDGTHYWMVDGQAGELSLTNGQLIADNAHTWYQTHNLSVQANLFARQLIGS